ncbi:MAG: heme lyase CcmF/NrfE family subunit [Candidatus Obscuribacterales bacterium]|nr:heme lyase CcmF/NrfE family subunit [Steroidobacteraceae bacterium]
MIVELGHFALVLALCLAAVQSYFGLVGASRANASWMATARSAVAGQFVFTALAFACLVYAFEQNDFSVKYVASHSNSALPAMYRFTAAWGGHEGSMLLWLLVLVLWSIGVAVFTKSMTEPFISRVLGVLGLVSIGVGSFILFTSNPFERLIPAAVDGVDLNPLLQDPGFIIHPPTLYVGYVGMSVPFAFAVAALLEGKLDANWARALRPWTNIAWAFLTVGITLGSWWAYYELGWGGWWFWDPVENSSFMPWLVGTALIHSLAVTEKRGLFKSWTLLLAIFAFSLSLLGTFLVRSGVLVSVHSFASDPKRGVYILALLVICIGGALILYALRASRFRSNAGFAMLSRESFLLFNNALLIVATVIVLVGTLFPLFIDALNLPKVSVGEPFYNAMFPLPMLPALVLLVFGMHAGWKRADFASVRKPLTIALIAAIIIGVALPLLGYGSAPLMTVVGVTLAAWLGISALIDPVSRIRRGHRLSPAVLGMSVAHLGVALFVLGVTIAKTYTTDRDVSLAPGTSVTLGQYELTFLNVRDVQGPNYTATEAEVSIKEDGKQIALLHPQKRIYRVQNSPMTESDFLADWHRHISVAMGEPLGGSGNAWSMRLQYRPLIRFVWMGALIMALGGVIAIFDRRYRTATADEKSAAAATVAVAK